MEKIDYSEELELNATESEVETLHIPKRYDIENNLDNFIFTDEDFDFQITYKFRAGIRRVMFNGIKYGSYPMTFRRLYELLCQHFNSGNYFIEQYFDSVYVSNGMKARVDEELAEVKEYLVQIAESYIGNVRIKADGTLDRRYKDNKGLKTRLRAYEKFAKQWENVKGKEIADLIKEDIISSLATGALPLSKTWLSKETMEKRIKAGLDSPMSVFYASGQLINNLILYVRIGGTGNWETQQGLMV